MIRRDFPGRRIVPCGQFLLVALLGCLAALGCRDAPPTLEELIERGAQLPGARASMHSELRAEFRLLEQSQSLPAQLNRDPAPAHQNAAVALADVLDDENRLGEVNGQLEAFFTALEYADPELVASEAGELAAMWAKAIEDVAAVSERETCDFQIQYERGFFNDLRFLSQSAAACRLLLVDAVYQTQRDRPAALRRFRQAWGWTDRLAAEQHLEARVQASLLRREALAVAEWLASGPRTLTTELLLLKQGFEQSLAHWPSDVETLRRERALGVATYEAIRLGLVDVLFTLEERSGLREEGVLESLSSATAEQVDSDEAAYLKYMREVIAVADQPYYQRAADLRECDRLLRVNEHREHYPWFACRLFVDRDSLTLAQSELARDRGRLEGWVLVISAATGASAPPYATNPLNGESYVLTRAGQELYVALGDRRTVNPRLTLPASTP